MQCSMRLIALLLAALIAEPVQAVTPLAKVVQMLEGMLAKGKEEKHSEEVQFASYKQFCVDVEAEKTTAIQEAADQIEMLKADILMHSTESSDGKIAVTGLQGDLATYEADKKAAASARKIEQTNYDAVHKDYTESIDAIRQAIDVLKTQGAKTYAQAPIDLLQGRFGKLPKEAHRAIEAFLARSDYEPPEAHGYEFQSKGVIDMLEELKEKFVEERTTLEKEEMKKRHAHDLLTADLTDSITTTKAAVSSKSQQIAKDDQIVAEKNGELKDTQDTKASDEKYLDTTKTTCEQKQSDFTKRQKLRADEIEAITQAIEILNSDEVMGSGKKYLPTDLLQRSGKRPMLVQLKRSQQGPSNQIRVAAYLHDEGERIRSPVLSALSIRVREDPFAKVKKMIQELITRLEQQAGEEASHKSWCEDELRVNGEARTKKTTAVEALESEIDEMNADIAKTALEIQELDSDLAQLNVDSDKDATFRVNEKAKNEQTIQDAQEAQKAVFRAIEVLREFYARASEATSLVQAHQEPTAPAIFDSPYKGQGPDGVISMLEVIQSDFARLESETTAAEEEAVREYNEKSTAYATDKATKSATLEHKKQSKINLETSLIQKKSDLTTTQKELNAANEYYEKLKPSCLETGVSYQEREQRRQEEIESLQEALRILNGEDLAVTG